MGARRGLEPREIRLEGGRAFHRSRGPEAPAGVEPAYTRLGNGVAFRRESEPNGSRWGNRTRPQETFVASVPIRRLPAENGPPGRNRTVPVPASEAGARPPRIGRRW